MRRGLFYPPGASRQRDGVQFVFSRGNSSGDIKLVIYGKSKILREYVVDNRYFCGDIASVILADNEIPKSATGYVIESGGERIRDIYASVLTGFNKYGNYDKIPVSGICYDEYDWEDDVFPCIPYEESVFYGLHVRGFTKHASSRVKARGCFAGITEKIPYLKELGITAVELMPAYEFDEVIKEDKSTAYADRAVKPDIPQNVKLNFWGYGAPAYYYAPKSAYSSIPDASAEFKDMVKALHRAGIEVIMQFFFGGDASKGSIGDILRYWVLEYHIDGVRIMGDNLPYNSFFSDPLLKNTKIICSDEASDIIYEINMENRDGHSAKRNAAIMSRGFTNDIRRCIKGDEDMLKNLINHLKANGRNAGNINAITTHDGFTLRDLVSYDYKHNSDNGEDGRDGTSTNYSWNCGEEGPSRKKAINTLRMRQMKNALMLMFIAQGTPYLRAGDEFGQSQNGNNNPYCQDNDITYLNWKLAERNKELVDYVRSLALLRKNHKTFSRREALMDMDYKSLGAPDISYHSHDLWKVSLNGHYRHIGILYNGAYCTNSDGKPDSWFYAALNFHWEDHALALPRLEEGLRWEVFIQTSSLGEKPADYDPEENVAGIKARSMALFYSVPDDKPVKNKKTGAIKKVPKDVTAF